MSREGLSATVQLFKEKEMRKQVGWQNPKNGLFCGMQTKRCSLSDEYTVPMFVGAVDDDGPGDEIQLQILENQCALLLATLNSTSQATSPNLYRNLVNLRRRTVEILEKERKNRENDPHKS